MAGAARTRAPVRLATQVLLLELAIIVLTVGAGFAVSFVQARNRLDARAGDKSLTIAHAVAAIPSVATAFSSADPAATIDPIVERIRRSAGAAFIVVADRRGVRYSHPNPDLIGTSLLNDPGENRAPVLSGRTFVGVQAGSLGRSIRAKVPLKDSAGRVIGLVSVGVLEQRVGSELRGSLPVTLVPPLLGLALGTVGAFLLARRVKRQTYGLEPPAIAALLEQREAMLHGVREGAITVDTAERLTLLNDEAGRLLGVDREAVGMSLADVIPAGRVRDVLTGHSDGHDQIVLLHDRVLLVNRMPVQVRGRAIGAVITLRDRTQLDGLLRELDDVRGLADALRAQEHEFANKLHVISGLIELGRSAEAVHFINVSSSMHQQLAGSLIEQVGDPIVSALLMGKASVASERGITLEVSAANLPALPDPGGLVTVLGNLIDNAFDSAGQGATGGRVRVSISVSDADLVMQVQDTGPGIDPALVDEIFRDGFTTKVAHGDNRRRGLGLALASQEVQRRHGRITVENVDGARFTAIVPLSAAAGDLQPTPS